MLAKLLRRLADKEKERHEKNPFYWMERTIKEAAKNGSRCFQTTEYSKAEVKKIEKWARINGLKCEVIEEMSYVQSGTYYAIKITW